MIGVIGFGEGDATLDACGPDAAFGAPQRRTEPSAIPPMPGPYV
jgi:hypothetical protein